MGSKVPLKSEKIISRVTVENQLVLDPMMGSGTNGVAALKAKQKIHRYRTRF